MNRSAPDAHAADVGAARLLRALRCSVAGVRHAVRTEAAFRQEAIAIVIASPLALLLPVPAIERLLLVASMVLVLVVELLNSAIEAAVDRISLDRHPLSGQAKDLASAAVAVALALTLACWLVIAGPLLLGWAGR